MAIAKFGQPLIKTSEPFGKRSFLGRSIAISILAVSRVLSHATKTRNAAVEWKLRPPPSKAARTILTAHNQVKPSHDRVVFAYIFDFIHDIALLASAAHSVTPHRSSSPRDLPIWPIFRRPGGIKAMAANVDFADAVFDGGFAGVGDAPWPAGV
ncbi:hypothetical protein QY049_34730 [Bradyrhizobium sp. WYCCWR 13022]|uniref:hypothetical protein n=1 Tax=unclassified Bradyrhizobium TaxID=2631580 RepID=UPI00263B10DE|nr:hypothetical protein [Bradyrhizobium sp. WYCCWR 13022]MDN4988324.1 hypothetical protein [Bradyrhizobium sp. WYCCWR 13022]